MPYISIVNRGNPGGESKIEVPRDVRNSKGPWT